MKILITGQIGFIGSKLTSFLQQKGYKVNDVSRKYSDTSKPKKIKLNKQFNYDYLFKRNTFDVVIHLGAIIENEIPMKMFEANCNLTLNLLENCKKHDVRKLIFASTHGVYGATQYLPIDEEHKTNPTTNYTISKLIAENICKMYYNSYNLPTIILRISSVYGENMNLKRLIPVLVKSSIKNKNMTIHEYLNGFQLMDLIHVKDVCKAIECSIKSRKKYGVYNIATGKPETAKTLAKEISKINKAKIKIKKIQKETNHFYYDITKAKKELNFKPKIFFKEIVEEIFNDIKNKI